MKRILPFIFLFIFLESCIPLRIAPSIDDYKLTKGRNFKRGLPERTVFIFEEPKEKEANEFYTYVNVKYQLEHDNVYDDVPFQIDGEQYFFSFYETDIQDKSIPILGIFMDVLISKGLDSDDYDPIFSPNDGVTRKGNWYIVIEVYSDKEKDCLAIDSLSREIVLKYLRILKKEYLSTHNYDELVFKN